MKVLIIGATGGTGQYVVKQALALGHKVTAFVRNPAKIQNLQTNDNGKFTRVYKHGFP